MVNLIVLRLYLEFPLEAWWVNLSEAHREEYMREQAPAFTAKAHTFRFAIGEPLEFAAVVLDDQVLVEGAFPAAREDCGLTPALITDAWARGYRQVAVWMGRYP